MQDRTTVTINRKSHLSFRMVPVWMILTHPDFKVMILFVK